MTKEEVKEALKKKPSDLSREELKFIFSVFCFAIKEYEKTESTLSFEIHYKRTYLIKVKYPVLKGLMSFRNEFIDFDDDGTHAISMSALENTSELLTVFINMFYDNILKKVGYQGYWDEDLPSPFQSLEEAQEMLSFVQNEIDKNIQK